MKTIIVSIGLIISTSAMANCPNHNTVTYTCSPFQNHIQCSWNPKEGWYEGTTNQQAVSILPGSQAERFLRAYWTPNAHSTPDGIQYGFTICQYSFRGEIVELFQTDRNVNIPDPKQKTGNLWSFTEWQRVKGYGCEAGEKACQFAYGEQF